MTSDRKKRIEFHVMSNDYFATLATLISFLRESLEEEAKAMGKTLKEVSHSAETLYRIHQDLLHLQHEYKIEKKIKS